MRTEQQEVMEALVKAADGAGWDVETKGCELRAICNVFLVLAQPGGITDSLQHLVEKHGSVTAARMMNAVCVGMLELMPLMEEAAPLLKPPLSIDMPAVRASIEALADKCKAMH